MYFNWLDADKPIRICISDNLGKLLPHAHDEIELMYFYKSAGGKYSCGGKNISFTSKNLLVVNPWECHGCDDWGNACVAACVIINTKMLSALSIKGQVYENKISDIRLDADFNELRPLIFANNLNYTEKECRINSIIYNILGTLSHYAKEPTVKKRRRAEIDQILKFIDENISENLTLEMLAENACLSKDRFYHIFKEDVGVAPSKYIVKERIKKACGLLINTDMSVQEIADECGFCTSAYFSKIFSEYMDISPSGYRKQGYTCL